MKLNRRNFIQISSALPLLGACGSLPTNPVAGRVRARDLGVHFGGLPTGRWNAITDVKGVEVGHTTIIRGSGKLEPGKGPVRTGVTAIWPGRGVGNEFFPCGIDAPNGNGEMTGMLQARQQGVLTSPLCLTNTSSVGMVYDKLLELQPDDELPAGVPVVGETWDGYLNDVTGRHVHHEHVQAALDQAASGPVEEGAVGGGTGMVCYGFKGGIGTSSRLVTIEDGNPYTVGALVQTNHGGMDQLRIDGVPVGQELKGATEKSGDQNSILMIIATDAPLLSHQLNRIARRATHGLARTGSISGNASGDFTLAFSTSNPIQRRAFWQGEGYKLHSVEQFDIHPLLQATSDAVEEAIINSLCMAVDMDGIDGASFSALPLEQTREIMYRHGRLFEPQNAAGGDNLSV